MKENSIKRKVISVVTAMGLLSGATAQAVSAARNDYYDEYDPYYNEYYNNNNYNLDNHINVDIQDPAILQRYLADHAKNCTDYDCAARGHYDYLQEYYPSYYPEYNPNYYPEYNPNYYPNYNQYEDNYVSDDQYDNQNYEGVLYTLVKYTADGNAVYAYSGTQDVAKYGFSGWQLNSLYNSNDYSLNSVFYEEKYRFGNNFDWNEQIVNLINQTSGLYIWRYYDGDVHYCVSPNMLPNSDRYEFNSKYFVANDLKSQEELPTYESVQARGYSRQLY